MIFRDSDPPFRPHFCKTFPGPKASLSWLRVCFTITRPHCHRSPPQSARYFLFSWGPIDSSSLIVAVASSFACLFPLFPDSLSCFFCLTGPVFQTAYNYLFSWESIDLASEADARLVARILVISLPFQGHFPLPSSGGV